METKAHWVLAGASAQEPVCRRQGGPVASGPGGSPARRISAAAGFLLGRAVNLNGVFPHCVFLLLEDPGQMEHRLFRVVTRIGAAFVEEIGRAHV